MQHIVTNGQERPLMKERVKSESEKMAHEAYQLCRLASGRRIVNFCLFSWFAASVFHVTESILGPVFILIALIAGIIGSIRLIFALDMSSLWRSVFLVVTFLPLVSLIPMFLLSTRAATVLKAEGYQVGMFEARKQKMT